MNSAQLPKTAQPQRTPQQVQPQASSAKVTADEQGPLDKGCSTRVVSEEEIEKAEEKDPELTTAACKRILARLNIKAHYHIAEDIRKKKPIKAPNDFRAYKSWTPMPMSIPEASGIERLILVVLDVPFLGWYAHGHLVGDSMACIGNSEQPTQPGLYKILEKDADHYSRSYNNSFGQQAWMPWAMRIYEAVWIHAGDITGAYCSHGCVTLPVKEAQDLFAWTGSDATVLIVDSLADMKKTLKR